MNPIRKVAFKEKQELTTYSFLYRYVYFSNNQPKADGIYMAHKQIADVMDQKLDTDLSYSRFQTNDLASTFEETSLLAKETFYS